MVSKDQGTDRLAGLSADKQALLEQRLLARKKKASVIEKRTNGASAPLSFSQQRLWMLDQLMPGDSAYNMLFPFRLRGELNETALENSITEIVRRHEILRTVFIEHEDEPLQKVLEHAAVELQREDLTHYPAEEAEGQAMHRAVEQFREPFDLSRGPLLRLTLQKLAEDDHILLLGIHHILFDGWSLDVFTRELTQLYTAFAKGEPSPLPELSVQYGDYAAWQRSPEQSKRLQEQLAFWTEHLQGKLPVLQLPADRPRPAVQTTNGAGYTLELPGSLLPKLKALSEQEDVMMFPLLLAAFYTLLYRYTGETDIIVGSTVSNRSRRELEEVLGFFVNTLALRGDLTGAPSFRELLSRVRETVLSALSNQDVPFEKLVEVLQPDRDVSRTPLFQVMFEYQRADGGAASEGLSIELMEIEEQFAKFDLNVAAVEAGERLYLSLTYNTDLFEPRRMEKMMEHFTILLEGITAQPDLPIDRLPLVSDAEQHDLVFGWNQTQVEFPENTLLHELFEAQAQQTPDNIAAIYGDATLTYAELDARANQLAHRLQQYGVGPDVPVGVCIERSLELVVALVGILKAGGAFLPLDTEAPSARLAQVLEDAQAPVCLSQASLAGKHPQDVTSFLLLDAQWEEIAAEPVTKPDTSVGPEHLVSIYYTSGSTGKPKGVASIHRGWVNRMCWMQRQHGLTAQETVLQKTTLTFDDAAVEFYWPLMVGARIALLEPVVHRDPREILDAAIRYQAAVLQFVPSMLAMVLDTITEQGRAQLDCVRVVVSSGEALRPEIVRQFLDRMPGHLHNTWGATEVSIDSTIQTCTARDAHGSDIVSVGRPIDNNRAYVLDAHLQPVPAGVAGDLYLAGVGLARGYLNDPERTDKAFVADPFFPGERMYKTGDRGYFRTDGAIQFLGRQDNQVKIRGMRIELGEVENVMLQHPAVKEAVVIAREEMPGVKTLVGYVVLRDELSTGELRGFLKGRLPEYMVPGYLMTLDTLPLNANGKTDRHNLPEPELERPDLEAEYLEPETDIEIAVAAIWTAVLGVEKIGVQDSFFDLGGHSLLATQVVSRIRKKYDVDLPLRVLFETPTIEELAGAVEDLLLEKLETMSEEEVHALLGQ